MICLKGSRFPQDTPQYNNLNTKHQGMCPNSAFRKIWNVDRNGNIVMNAHVFGHGRGLRHSAETPRNQFYSFGLWTGNEIRLESSLSLSSYNTFLVPFSHVQSHPGMHASNPGWLWTRSVLEFERVIKYHEYTHGFVVPLWLLWLGVKMSAVIMSEVKNVRGKNVRGNNVRGNNVRGKNVRGNNVRGKNANTTNWNINSMADFV